MNVENILKVADALEQHSIPRLGFNMRLFYAERGADFEDRSGHNCRTVACIAGWAYTVERGRMPRSRLAGEREAPAAAAAYLDLGRDAAHALFWPDYDIRDAVTPSQAVAVLRHLAATGKVDWSIAK